MLLNARRSRRCDTPLLAAVSYRLPVSTKSPSDVFWPYVSSEATRSPLASVVILVSGTGRLDTGCEVEAGRLGYSSSSGTLAADGAERVNARLAHERATVAAEAEEAAARLVEEASMLC